MRKEIIETGKFLALILRHKPETIGIKLDSNGWVDVQELIDKASIYQKTERHIPLTKKILDEIVATNDKKRFEYSEDGWSIRASQGHSIAVALDLDPIDPPEFLYHGTAEKFLDAIKISGIKKMSRNHVHMNANPQMSLKVGMRHGKPVVLKIRAKEMDADGYKFFLSKNNVWLTEEVPIKYIDVN